MVLSREPDAETSLAIDIAFMCKELHVLPGPGGLLDQDPYHILILKAGLQAIAEKNEREAKKTRR